MLLVWHTHNSLVAAVTLACTMSCFQHTLLSCLVVLLRLSMMCLECDLFDRQRRNKAFFLYVSCTLDLIEDRDDLVINHVFDESCAPLMLYHKIMLSWVDAQ